MTLSSSLFNSCWYKLKHLQKPVSSDSYSLATHGVRNHLHLFILNLLVVSSLIQWSFFLVRKERTIIPCSLTLTYIFINVPAVWKQNTDFLLKNNSWNQIFFTLDDQMKQQEVVCLYTACPAVLQFPDKTVDLGTSCCPCFLNLSVQVIRLLHTVWLAFQGYLKKKGFHNQRWLRHARSKFAEGEGGVFHIRCFLTLTTLWQTVMKTQITSVSLWLCANLQGTFVFAWWAENHLEVGSLFPVVIELTKRYEQNVCSRMIWASSMQWVISFSTRWQ